MAAIIEHVRSRTLEDSLDDPSVELEFCVYDEPSEQAAYALLKATAPAKYFGLPVRSARVEPAADSDRVWNCLVGYSRSTVRSSNTSGSGFNGPSLGSDPGSGPDAHTNLILSFDTGSSTVRRTQAIQNVNRIGDGETNPPNFQGAIGFDGERIEGVDVIASEFNYSYTLYLPVASVTTEYIKTLRSMKPSVNDAPFDGWEEGEVLLRDVRGSVRDGEDWEITFSFGVEENVTGFEVGDLVPFDKKGWDYVWYYYEEDVDEDVIVRKPKFAFIEQVYERKDFSLLGLGV